MLDVIGSIVQKRHYLIADEEDVMSVVKVIDEIKRSSKIHKVMNMELGNCEWSDDPTAWFINFDVTDRQWRKAMNMIHNLGYRIVLRDGDRLYLDKN